MGLFERRASLFSGPAQQNPFNSPGMSLTNLALDAWQMPQPASAPSGPEIAYQTPTAIRCIELIAGKIASVDLTEYDSHDVQSPWSIWQNLVSFTAFEATQRIVADLLVWGNYYALKVMQNGRLVDLQPIYPGFVSVARTPQGKVFKVRTSNGAAQQYTEAQILHIPYLSVDGTVGISKVQLNLQTFRTLAAADQLAENAFTSGNYISGVIQVKNPLEDERQAAAIKQRAAALNNGVGNAGAFMVMDSESSFTQLQPQGSAMQHIDARLWQAQEIARIFAVPEVMLFGGTQYGSATEAQQQGLVSDCLAPLARAIEQRLMAEFGIRGRTLRFDLDSLVTGTQAERYTNINAAIAGGWMTPAQAREAENMSDDPKVSTDYLEPASMNAQLQMPPLSMPGATPVPQAQALNPVADDDDNEDDSDD